MKIVNLGQVLKRIDNVQKEADKKTLEVFKYLGETFVKSARENREFEDDTGNLQSSIGYAIAKDGKMLFESINGLGDEYQELEGREHGLRLAEAVIRDNSSGWVLVGLAGMDYGIYVEARGIDVISGSIPGTQKILKEIINGLGLDENGIGHNRQTVLDL